MLFKYPSPRPLELISCTDVGCPRVPAPGPCPVCRMIEHNGAMYGYYGLTQTESSCQQSIRIELSEAQRHYRTATSRAWGMERCATIAMMLLSITVIEVRLLVKLPIAYPLSTIVPALDSTMSTAEKFQPFPMLVLDGGLVCNPVYLLCPSLLRRITKGTTLEDVFHKDISTPLWSAKPIEDDPEVIIAAHLAFLRAGADVILTSTYVKDS